MSILAIGTTTGHSSGSGGLIMVIWGLFAIAIGSAHVVSPAISWRMSKWKYRNPEAMRPSDAALTMTRVGGGVFVIIGAVFLVIGATKL